MQTSCVNPAETKPFLVLIPSVFIQFWISSLLSKGNRNSNSEEDRQDPNRTSINSPPVDSPSSWKSSCVKTVKNGLKIWQITSIIIIFIMDILDYIESKNSHKDRSGWQHYNCFVQIMLNSSNFKTCLVGGFVTLWTFQDIVRSHHSHDDFGRMDAIKQLHREQDGTHVIPGLLCYIWIMIGLSIVFICVFVPIVYVISICNGTQGGFVGVKYEHLKKYQKVIIHAVGFKPEMFKDASDPNNVNNAEWLKSPFFTMVIVLSALLPALSTIYWYSGKYDYFESFVMVLTERSITIYFSNIFNGFTTIFRFVSQVF
eukprot:692531_1